LSEAVNGLDALADEARYHSVTKPKLLNEGESANV
jgi:hypothetical protein